MSGEGTGVAKADIQTFWKEVYDVAYGESDRALTGETLLVAIDELEDMFRLRGHMAVVEMPLEELAGKQVLEVGCGAGGHSALFARHGARMTSLDLTFERSAATARKFALMGDRAAGCNALNSDAELLPFADGTFDLVYSNGVLHHSPDTGAGIAEIHRVLRPGGSAIIMLYCKSSWHYWIHCWLCVGILLGRAFRDPNWLGHATEWSGPSRQIAINPITSCYTARQMRGLFADFEALTLRKREFYFYLIPKLGGIWRRYQIRRYGTHPGGRLVYGAPWPKQSPLELWLGKYIGWAWFAHARKPGDGAAGRPDR